MSKNITSNTLQNIIGREQLLFKEKDVFEVVKVSAAFDEKLGKWIYWPPYAATHNLTILTKRFGSNIPVTKNEDIILYSTEIKTESGLEIEFYKYCPTCCCTTRWKLINGIYDCEICPKFSL